jgi:hypothetical protein
MGTSEQPSFIEQLTANKDDFLLCIADNYESLTPEQQALIQTFYLADKQIIDVEKFQVIMEYYIFQSQYENQKQYAEATENWRWLLPWNAWKRDIATLEKPFIIASTWWKVHRTYGEIPLREIVHSAQLLNYAVVDNKKWETSKALGCIHGSPLYEDPVFKRFQYTVLDNTADFASNLSDFFTATDFIPWQGITP